MLNNPWETIEDQLLGKSPSQLEVTAPTQYVVHLKLPAVAKSFDHALHTYLGVHTCLRSFEGALLGENCPGKTFSLVMLRRGTRGFAVFDDEFAESEILRGGLELEPTGFRAFVMLVIFESFFLSGLLPCCCCFRPPVLPIIGIIPPLACILPALGVQTCQPLCTCFYDGIACNEHKSDLAKVTCEYMKNG